MFRHAIPIGRIFGIAVDLDYSWFLIVGLLTWMLAVSYYPASFQGSAAEYWLTGFVTAVLLFVSVLIHELGHSIVAQGYGLRVPRITLFLFGGVSQMAAEPPGAAAEFWIAVVGPLVSFALAAFFWEIEPLLAGAPAWFATAKYLALLNLILGIFNLVPGFPLDGGRVFRAMVWRATGAYQRATAVAATTGRFIGFVMIFRGVWDLLRGDFINGLWIAFIGWYLESAAGAQLQMERAKMLIGEHRVADAMRRDFPHLDGATTLEEIGERFLMTGRSRYFVVNSSNGERGLVTLATIQSVPRNGWATTTVAQVMTPAEKLNPTTPQAGLWAALEAMGRNGVSELPVMEGNEIVGMLSSEDVLHYLQVLQMFVSGQNGRRPGIGQRFPVNRGHTHLP